MSGPDLSALTLTGFPGFVFLLHSTSGAERLPDAVERNERGSDWSGAGTADPPPRGAPSVVILGADALLAAQPATAVQLAHACLRVGYQAVVPASWGDELIAGRCLDRLAARRATGTTGGSGAGPAGPAIFCACPYVAHRLLAAGPDLEPFLASFVAPPVVVARYLRAIYEPTRLRLTYVGRCPGAGDDAIDARLTPEELLAVLAERQIDVTDQPRAFDSVIPPDRRRFLSQPGGLPVEDAVRHVDPTLRIVEVTGSDLAIELAQHLLSRADVLIDVAPRVGCACSGTVIGVTHEGARDRVAALEPPRAASAVVDPRVPVSIDLPLPPVARTPTDVVPAVAGRRVSGASRAIQRSDAPPAPAPPVAGAPVEAPAAPAEPRGGSPPAAPPAAASPAGVRRRSPAQGTVRQSGSVPTTRSGEGRALPRAYVARRGTGGRGRGPSTPPRGESARRLDASAGDRAEDRGGGRGENGGSASRGTKRGAAASVRDRAQPPAPSSTPPSASVAGAPPTPGPPPPSAIDTSGESLARSMESAVAAATIGSAPDHAADPHGDFHPDPFNIPEDVVQEAARAAAQLRPAPPPISELGPPPVASFRIRSTTLARMAVGAARQRRTAVAALLAVALLSASVGILAGRWLAARAAAPASVR